MITEAEQKATSELQDLHKTAADYKECFEQLTKEHEEVMAQMKSQVEELSGVVTAKDEHISQIEAELARMNELMKESSESPDVTAELARLIKSGLTYSQLYHKYHQTAEQLAVEKGESSRLNDCLDTLVKEIDVMRPQVTQLRNAYEAASSMVQKLSEQLKANLQNLDDEARKAGESQKMAIHYQKETNKYRVENEDLALQVQVLTKEIHVAKDVISNQLVSFKDIQELQKQNQQLRLALRSLSEAQEASDKSGEGSEKSKALEMELANTRQEVGFLKQSRLKQEELVQSIIKQRDMYKRLVNRRC
ncbi:TPR [Bugula neritina]|uniref:TPR n=1 Tax=Bugula neritina TaxID=10212 RepID=A0A7J7JTB4_BUGNE|nr:TPR [Bugula neritina]